MAENKLGFTVFLPPQNKWRKKTAHIYNDRDGGPPCTYSKKMIQQDIPPINPQDS